MKKGPDELVMGAWSWSVWPAVFPPGSGRRIKQQVVDCLAEPSTAWRCSTRHADIE
ncbi:hypothetical protein [Xylophilus sp. GOD-11R]|uniref:hypothetical protein n=1 Tax=Xylophilus sp. GOD-11R TaxID=3089814 RepID=UPI00298D4581|nr:hypothetical protein [Xylophilus sp. GOD-11R]WPB55387.1 hypothetical protein R9X41_14690 [Xylophilus sp. GOD-11R]